MMEFLGQELLKEFVYLFFVLFLFLCTFAWKTVSNFLKSVDKKLNDLDEKVEKRFNDVSNLVEKFKEESDETDRAILRGEILDRIERARNQNCVSRDYYEITLAMYEAYHARQGNGVVDKEWIPFENKALCSK